MVTRVFFNYTLHFLS